jgi:hypothetical protein
VRRRDQPGVISEVDIYGLLVSPMLLWVGAAMLLSAFVRRALGWLGVYRFVWHRPLFDLALLVILVGGVVAVQARWPLQ